MYGSAIPRVTSKHPGPQPPPEISHCDCAGVNCTQKKAWRPLDGDLESSDFILSGSAGGLSTGESRARTCGNRHATHSPSPCFWGVRKGRVRGSFRRGSVLVGCRRVENTSQCACPVKHRACRLRIQSWSARAEFPL